MDKHNIATIYFSKNRPSQLDLALTTNEEHSVEWELQNEFVIYKASDVRFATAYEKVFADHYATEIKQVVFKDDLLKCIKGSEYILFVVDDCIFTNNYSLEEMRLALQGNPEILGFSLRLGKNTEICYPTDLKNNMPVMRDLPVNCTNEIRMFDWLTSKTGDFAYPLELSSSMYRTKDIIEILRKAPYTGPNSLEWMMWLNSGHFVRTPSLACYETSVAFCAPVNKVQKDNNNRAGKNPLYSIEELLKKYEKGYKIDPAPFDGFVSKGCHQEVNFEFIKE